MLLRFVAIDSNSCWFTQQECVVNIQQNEVTIVISSKLELKIKTVYILPVDTKNWTHYIEFLLSKSISNTIPK